MGSRWCNKRRVVSGRPRHFVRAGEGTNASRQYERRVISRWYQKMLPPGAALWCLQRAARTCDCTLTPSHTHSLSAAQVKTFAAVASGRGVCRNISGPAAHSPPSQQLHNTHLRACINANQIISAVAFCLFFARWLPKPQRTKLSCPQEQSTFIRLRGRQLEQLAWIGSSSAPAGLDDSCWNDYVRDGRP